MVCILAHVASSQVYLVLRVRANSPSRYHTSGGQLTHQQEPEALRMPTYKLGKTYLLNQPSTTNWTCRILENLLTLTEWLRPYTHKRYSQKACICKGTIFAPFWKWLRAICHLVKQEGQKVQNMMTLNFKILLACDACHHSLPPSQSSA